MGDAREHTDHKPTSTLDKYSLLLLRQTFPKHRFTGSKQNNNNKNKNKTKTQAAADPDQLWLLTLTPSSVRVGHPLLSTFVQALEPKDSKVA